MNAIGINPGILNNLFSTHGTPKKILHAVDRLLGDHPGKGDAAPPVPSQQTCSAYTVELSLSYTGTYRSESDGSDLLVSVQEEISASVSSTWLADPDHIISFRA